MESAVYIICAFDDPPVHVRHCVGVEVVDALGAAGSRHPLWRWGPLGGVALDQVDLNVKGMEECGRAGSSGMWEVSVSILGSELKGCGEA